MKKKKLRIIVLLHESLNPPLDIEPKDSYDKDWRTEFAVINCLRYLGHEVEVIPISNDLNPINNAVKNFKPHIAFNLLEEFNGEAIFDAHVVSYLELLGLKYSGCNSRGLILARDKALSKKILSYHRIAIPKFITMKRGKIKKINKLQYPLFVKSLNEEASLGISQASLVRDEKSLKERVEFIFDSLETDALVEEFIEGRELYIGALGNKRVEIFPPAEMQFGKSDQPEMQFATRSAKWDNKYRERNKIESDICKDLPASTRNKIEEMSKKAFKLLGLNSYARLDIRLRGEEPFILEANPNPAIAPEDEYAFMAEAAGYSYEQLIQKILRLGMTYKRSV